VILYSKLTWFRAEFDIKRRRVVRGSAMNVDEYVEKTIKNSDILYG
jgi:hypothetical protein